MKIAIYYNELNYSDEANVFWKKVLKLVVDDNDLIALANFRIGVYQMKTRKYKKAISSFENCMKTDQSVIESHKCCLHMAKMLKFLGNYDEALELIKKGVEFAMDANQFRPFYNILEEERGRILFEMGKYEESLKCFKDEHNRLSYETMVLTKEGAKQYLENKHGRQNYLYQVICNAAILENAIYLNQDYFDNVFITFCHSVESLKNLYDTLNYADDEQLTSWCLALFRFYARRKVWPSKPSNQSNLIGSNFFEDNNDELQIFINSGFVTSFFRQARYT